MQIITESSGYGPSGLIFFKLPAFDPHFSPVLLFATECRTHAGGKKINFTYKGMYLPRLAENQYHSLHSETSETAETCLIFSFVESIHPIIDIVLKDAVIRFGKHSLA